MRLCRSVTLRQFRRDTESGSMRRMFAWSDVYLLYRRELRSALRERNIVVNSILLPIFLYPLLLWLTYSGITFVTGQTEGFASRVMLRNLPAAHRGLEEVLRQGEQIELKNSPDPLAAIKNEALDVLVEFISEGASSVGLADNFRVRFTYDKSKDRSRIARSRVESVVRRYRDRYLEKKGEELGLSAQEIQQFSVSSKNIASSRQMGQFMLGLMLPLFLIVMLAVGGIFPAIDATAGEREKSTWETLMTTATARGNIILAKYLYVATMTAAAGILNIIAMMLSVRTVVAPILGEQMEDFSFQFPLRAVPLILLVTLLLALFIAAGMMILASFARTFKEGQSLVSPLYVAIFLPAMFLQFPGIQFTPALALIPVVNVVMVFREAIAGIFQWHLIGITLAVESLSVILALWVAAIILRYEDFLVGSYDGSFGKFFRERVIGRRRRRGTK